MELALDSNRTLNWQYNPIGNNVGGVFLGVFIMETVSKIFNNCLISKCFGLNYNSFFGSTVVSCAFPASSRATFFTEYKDQDSYY